MRNKKQIIKSIIPSKSFYYDGMTPAEKVIYNRVYKCLLAKEKSITIRKISDEEINGLLYALSFDHPELFYVNLQSVSYTYTSEIITFNPQYLHLDEADLINQKIDALVDKLNRIKDTYERFLAISDIFYNFNYGPLPNNDEHTIYGPLIKGTGVCQGFSSLFQLLCQRVGIECISIASILNGTPHAYNVVELNNKLYYVDITNSMSAYRGSDREIKYIYINVPSYALLDGYCDELIFDCNNYEDNPYYRSNRGFTDKASLDACIRHARFSFNEKTFMDLSPSGILNESVVQNMCTKLGTRRMLTMGRYVKFFML